MSERSLHVVPIVESSVVVSEEGQANEEEHSVDQPRPTPASRERDDVTLLEVGPFLDQIER